MDIKELDKKQLILLTLLITFVVSIATGIVTVSLMNQAPKSVPQTINNVIQRTIEKVTTIESPLVDQKPISSKEEVFVNSGDVLVSIYPVVDGENNSSDELKEVGQGVLISDSGLLLVENNILNESLSYKVVLNKIDFDLKILKKFDNGFTIMKISEKKVEVKNPTEAKSDPTNVPNN